MGCPTCRVRPRQRCRTMRTRYPHGYVFGDGVAALGRPTAAHRARYELWCYLWGRAVCEAITPWHEHERFPKGKLSPDLGGAVPGHGLSSGPGTITTAVPS